MRGTKKLGELLKDAGLIDDFQLQTALSHQRNWGGKLGSTLVELGFLHEEDVAQVIAQKLKIPYARLFDPPIPEEAVQSLTADVAKKYRVMPITREKKAIVIAMSDPLDIGTMDDLRFITGLTVKPALAFESEIIVALKKYYDHEEVNYRSRPFRKDLSLLGKGVVISHGQDGEVPAEARDESSTVLPAAGNREQQASPDYALQLDSVIALLIEKGLFTRDEFDSMLIQKKLC